MQGILRGFDPFVVPPGVRAADHAFRIAACFSVFDHGCQLISTPLAPLFEEAIQQVCRSRNETIGGWRRLAAILLGVFCLTSEADSNVRSRKIRAMLIRKDYIESLVNGAEPGNHRGTVRDHFLRMHSSDFAPAFECEEHSTRWETLKLLAQQYDENSDKFATIEINV